MNLHNVDDELYAGSVMRRALPVLAALGCLINGALYLVLVFIMAMRAGNFAAQALAVTATGLVYLNCAALMIRAFGAAFIFSGSAIGVGLVAGLLLLRG